MKYNEKLIEHYKNPRNVGELDNPDGVGLVGNPACGDITAFYIKVKDNVLEQVKFKTYGCGMALSISSILSEMMTGKTLEEAKNIKPEDLQIGFLPKNKLHCSYLGIDALHKAIEDYESKLPAR